jgi:hypothetical protein
MDPTPRGIGHDTIFRSVISSAGRQRNNLRAKRQRGIPRDTFRLTRRA